MGDLTEARIKSVRRLLEQAPDKAIANLDALLAGERSANQAASAAIRRIIDGEAQDRRLRQAVFAPLLPIFTPPGEVPRLSLPAALPGRLWAALKRVAPDRVEIASQGLPSGAAAELAAPGLDALCRLCAEGLRDGDDPGFAPVAQDLPTNRRHDLALLLDLAPVLRRAVASLPAWLVNAHGEHDAAMRIAFNQAADLGDNAGFLFMEALFAHLEEPTHILRLIAVVMDTPTERYLAASELASFGVRLLASIDERIAVVRRFDVARGLEGGVATASAAATASRRLGEMGRCIVLAKEGVWGAQVASLRRSLALAMETRLREVEPAILSALPAQAVRQGVKRMRGPALVDEPPNQGAVNRAFSLAALLDGCRSSAHDGGFGAVRRRVVANLDSLLESYTEELVALLHQAGPGDETTRNIRAFLDVAAELVSLVRDPGAADLVRRRAAAA